jgi:hypothetical protein
MFELNAVNTNAGVKEKKKKRTEKGSVITIVMTEEMMTAEDIKVMTTDIAVKVPEIKRKDRRNERFSATNQQQIKMQRKQGGGTLTLVLPST